MPIQILPAQLANQIAAGEVVERPASVVKELVENSLDAGATSIEVELDKGGHKRICVRDNGSGVDKEELALALSRHATSKITCLDDLEAIISLGFRGEALASISSVARLTITSKPRQQPQAWMAQAEGRDMAVTVQPAAHPDGTSVEVLDLFFNTPARRKFLRAEKTEFGHVDELIRRIALSRYDVSFTLKHNGKMVRRYPALKKGQQRAKRLAAVCGQAFCDQAIEIRAEYQGMDVYGWLGAPSLPRSQNDLQYFYVNGRMMRDKLINHAIRQAFEGLLDSDQYPAYVLYFTLDAEQVDVNVHPAKHEVRFHQARMVHDFIFRVLTDALNQAVEASETIADETFTPQAPRHDYIRPLQTEHRDITTPPRSGLSAPGRPSSATAASPKSSGYTQEAAVNYESLMSVGAHIQEPDVAQTIAQGMLIANDYVLASVQQQPVMFRLATLRYAYLDNRFQQAIPVAQPLLMPVSLLAEPAQIERAKTLATFLEPYNIELGWAGKRVLIRKVPAGFRELNWGEVLSGLLAAESPADDAPAVKKLLLQAMAAQLTSPTSEEIWQWFCRTHAPHWVEASETWGVPIPLHAWLQEYDNKHG